MALLALDLGTHCGWAVYSGGQRIDSGSWTFETKPKTKSRPATERFTQFIETIENQIKTYQVTEVGYDRVRYGSATTTALFGGWLACLAQLQFRYGFTILECSSSEVIKAAQFKRISSKKEPNPAKRRERRKEALVSAAKSRGWSVQTDDEAEACFIGEVISSKSIPVQLTLHPL